METGNYHYHYIYCRIYPVEAENTVLWVIIIALDFYNNENSISKALTCLYFVRDMSRRYIFCKLDKLSQTIPPFFMLQMFC